jgi:hypothetical protein
LNWARNRKAGQAPYLGSGSSAGAGSRRRQKLAISAQGDFDRQRIFTVDYLQIGRTDRLSLRPKSSNSRGAAFAAASKKLEVHAREGQVHSPRRHGFGRIPSRTYDSGAETQPGACRRHSPSPHINRRFQIWGLPPQKVATYIFPWAKAGSPLFREFLLDPHLYSIGRLGKGQYQPMAALSVSQPMAGACVASSSQPMAALSVSQPMAGACAPRILRQ